MEFKVNTQSYKEALHISLQKICFDRSSGDAFYLEDLFYPLGIDEGKYAFQNYSQQISQARKSKNMATHMVSPVSTSTVALTDKAIMSKKILSDVRRLLATQKASEGTTSEEVFQKDSRKEDLMPQAKLALEIVNAQKSSSSEFSRALGTAYEIDQERTREEEAEDLLLDEPVERMRKKFVLTSHVIKNRNLAVASAGHGKTTLLRRIALYYCDKERKGEENETLANKYGLPAPDKEITQIPCIIYLRNIPDGNYSLDKALTDSVLKVFQSTLPYGVEDEIDLEEIQVQVERWVAKNKGNFILLIDGLDEIADNMRLNFLMSLEDFLFLMPGVPIILTSRVAGLSETGVRECLERMEFRGRSIMPLTEEEAYEYSEKWIQITQPTDKVAALLDAVTQVQNEARFSYLKEFMRTPLDLLVVLKRIVHDSLALNRYQMFRDMMWEHFTSHEKRASKKRQLFEDTITLLSFLAYQMQKVDSMYISASEIEQLQDEVKHLNFQTALLRGKDTQSILEVLDSFAANVGIVEKDDRKSEPGYTFPIRAHQEFLTAYACCHLRIDSSKTKTNPSGILGGYIGDSRWLNIINFALSDLDSTSQREYDILLRKVFSETQDLEHLQQIIEADVTITTEDATILCERVLKARHLSKDQRKLLLACLKTRSAPAFNHALRVLYNSSESTQEEYLEANALAATVWGFDSGHSPFKEAVKQLHSEKRNQSILGATICGYLAQAAVEEGYVSEYKAQAIREIKITNELVAKLYEGALLYQDPIYVTALTGLWISKLEGHKLIKAWLDENLAMVVISAISAKNKAIQQMCLAGKVASNLNEYAEIIGLFTTLGEIPIQDRLVGQGKNNLFVSIFLQAVYEKSTEDLDINQVAIAICCLYYGWTREQFMEAWVSDICKGMPSNVVRKDMCHQSEQNHFDLIRKTFETAEKRYAKAKAPEVNALTSKDVFFWFRAGDLVKAANYCIQTRGIEPTSSDTNLAFLLRYGKIQQRQLETDEAFDIPQLLSAALAAREPVAITNAILYYLEQGDIEQSRKYINMMSHNDWKQVTEGFWEPELWERSQDPEGALVCVLASAFGNCEFEDYQEMLKVVSKKYSDVVTLISKVKE